MNEEELFARLITGSFPETLPDIPLPVYKKALIDAVVINEMLVWLVGLPSTPKENL